MELEHEIGLSSFRNDWQKASISILYTYGFISNGHEQFFKKHGLTSQQYNVLRILHDQYPTPVSTSFLREKMLDKMSDASRLVNRLNAKGLVKVAQNASDKRLVNITISQEGKKLFDSIDGDLPNLDALMQGLTQSEAQQLTTLLEKVRDSIKSADERIAPAGE
ncbi:MarR family transcriptional regulator [Pontibacter sp. 172403-2]|uniref:MarR family winged helix-turn-helix transcriptional regulator n=1 Tax=Pontibacter rufus TaxID=2791028 RepID=UPI0018AF771F|nr:MarR family transcriptional regulator [Pontibacter sp. 172403-2]MBF9253619.1 MarR family transcriptional regulator [Pontibacter sp. 172403-2]